MPLPPEILLGRQMFYDVLSGEFSPATDPLESVRTLGRLAQEAFSYGDEVSGPAVDAHVGVLYTPVWAPSVKVLVVCDAVGESDFLLLKKISLDTKDGPKLALEDVSLGNQRVIQVKDGPDTTALRLGIELPATKALITQAATRFFMQAARK